MDINVDLTNGVNKPPRGYRVYNLKGVDHPVIARKGGPTAEQIKNKSSYQELRNNQKEFGVASMMAKVLRNALSQGMSEICETYVSGRLTAQFRNLAKLEQGETGKRPLRLSKHGGNLAGFEFNTECPFDETFDTKYFIRPGSHRGHIILHFPAFIPKTAFNTPEEATNFKFSASLVSISDFAYSEDLGTYLPLEEEDHGQFGTYESQMLPILKMPIEPFTAQLSAKNGRPVSDNTGIFLVFAVRFFKYEEGTFHHLSNHSTMQIHQVY